MSDDSKHILGYASTIAVVGASKDPSKPGHSIPAQLQRYGFRVVPINPSLDSVLGEKAYPSLKDVPHKIDLVLVFRPGAEAPDIARQAVAAGARGLWLQTGITSPEARRIAEGAGLDFVEDRCIGVERSVLRIDKRVA